MHLSGPLTAEMIRETVLDAETGYLSHPSVVSGPYKLESYDGITAKFVINPYFAGTAKGYTPRIGEVEYTLAHNQNMIEKLKSGEFDLLDKVTMAEAIRGGIVAQMEKPDSLSMVSEPRVGLTLAWFMENSPKVQEFSVRAAIACCFDRDGFIRQYVGPFGIRVEGRPAGLSGLDGEGSENRQRGLRQGHPGMAGRIAGRADDVSAEHGRRGAAAGKGGLEPE